MEAPRPIGVYDSGLGGLTVVKRLHEFVPGEQIIYVGDTARVPYGGRSKEEIIQFSRQIINFLLSKDVKMVVVACNTSSAVALPTVVEEYGIPMVGMIGPAVGEAARITCSQRVGLLATQATVRSGAYGRELRRLSENIHLISQECPKLVPLIEAGQSDTAEAREAVAEYTAPLKAAEVDTVILGCTHYPFLIRFIAAEMGLSVTVIDPAVSVAREAKSFLEKGRRRSQAKERGEFFVSGDPQSFASNAAKLGWKITARSVDLSSY